MMVRMIKRLMMRMIRRLMMRMIRRLMVMMKSGSGRVEVKAMKGRRNIDKKVISTSLLQSLPKSLFNSEVLVLFTEF